MRAATDPFTHLDVAMRWRPGQGAERWRRGRARAVTRVGGEEADRFVVDAVDERTGNLRTFDTDRMRIELQVDRRWVSVAEWSTSTVSLFEGAAPDAAERRARRRSR